MGSDGFLYGDSTVPFSRKKDNSNIMFFGGQAVYFDNITLQWDSFKPVTSFIRLDNGILNLDSATFTNITYKMVKNFKPSL